MDPFQKDAAAELALALKSGRNCCEAWLFASPGSGKICTISAALSLTRAKQVVYLTAPGLVAQAASEVRRWASEWLVLRIHTGKELLKFFSAINRRERVAVVVNFKLLLSGKNCFKHKYQQEYLSWRGMRPSDHLFVVDECHLVSYALLLQLQGLLLDARRVHPLPLLLSTETPFGGLVLGAKPFQLPSDVVCGCGECRRTLPILLRKKFSSECPRVFLGVARRCPDFSLKAGVAVAETSLELEHYLWNALSGRADLTSRDLWGVIDAVGALRLVVLQSWYKPVPTTDIPTGLRVFRVASDMSSVQRARNVEDFEAPMSLLCLRRLRPEWRAATSLGDRVLSLEVMRSLLPEFLQERRVLIFQGVGSAVVPVGWHLRRCKHVLINHVPTTTSCVIQLRERILHLASGVCDKTINVVVAD